MQAEADQAEKYVNLSLAVTMGSLVCLLFTFLCKWIVQKQKIQQLEWDMATITAGDYTVTFDIKPVNYKQWLEHEYQDQLANLPQSEHVGPALALKKHIKENITEEVRELQMRI